MKFGFLFICLLCILFCGNVSAQEDRTRQPSFERRKCQGLTFSDSADAYFEKLMYNYTDTVFEYSEQGKDTILLFSRKGNKTVISGFAPDKKISGSFYEINGYFRLKEVQTDTCTIMNWVFKSGLDTITTFRAFPDMDLNPILIKFRTMYDFKWFCYEIPVYVKEGYGDELRSILARRMDAYYKLLKPILRKD